MLLLFSLIGSVYSSIPDVPIDGEFNVIHDDQINETEQPDNEYTHGQTAQLIARSLPLVRVLINCMIYWVTL